MADGQRTDAAERSAHVTRGSAPSASDWPMVEISPGVYRLRVVVEMEAALRAMLPENNDNPVDQGRPTFEACETARLLLRKTAPQ